MARDVGLDDRVRQRTRYRHHWHAADALPHLGLVGVPSVELRDGARQRLAFDRTPRGHRHNTPFVLGTSPVPSVASACRSANASALKAASARWWSFSPFSTSTWSVMRAAVANETK